MNRRDLLEAAAGTALLAVSSCAYAFRLLSPPGKGQKRPPKSSSDTKWGMVIDLTKCQSDCTACIDACHEENNVGHSGDPRWDIHWIRKVTIDKKEEEERTADSAKSVLLLCNHCDEPPCAQVCPVQATYKREDGIVVVDHHRCIGCRYCMIACPYNARFFNFTDNEFKDYGGEPPNPDHPKRSHGVAEACTLCAHRLDRGEEPKCVEVCPNGALAVGNLKDPTSDVSEMIASTPTKRIREGLGTEPKVYYIGL
ncbi:MAG: 4Fe-4S dicluster domain-containing protein [Planctomycetes bacterium]|nr:4Fe-4S dicluster domain-containing protein [Planctomycetota bacterium]